MAISDSLNRRLRARRDEDEHEDDFMSESPEEKDVKSLQEDSNSENEDEQDSDDDDGGDDSDDVSDDNQSTNSADDREAIQSEFRQISFGALAKAQNSIGRKRKRGDPQKPAAVSSIGDDRNALSSSSTLNDIRERLRLAREQKREQLDSKNNSDTTKGSKDSSRKTKPTSRSSKHAPTVQSSKIAVSRKRIIVEPPSVAKARDPRFDPTIAASSSKSSTAATEHAYAFLDEYRASELKQLQEQLRRTKDATLKEELKRAITSATDRQRALDNKRRERDIISEHKKKERQLIREGKKSQPYYLKKSDLKREVLKKKYESMGSKERAKALERRRKKVASKEKKDLPWARRGVEQ